jgi:hypothetical protein
VLAEVVTAVAVVVMVVVGALVPAFTVVDVVFFFAFGGAALLAWSHVT